MLAWVLASTAFFALGLAMVTLAHRQRVQTSHLREAVLELRRRVEQTLFELKEVDACRGARILDQIETDDSEIGDNLGRLHLLLDQLNGLMQGDVEGRRRRDDAFTDEWPPTFAGALDFASAEEFMKFDQLPPITGDEIDTADWETLFKRIRKDQKG